MNTNIYSSTEFLKMDSAYWGLGFANKTVFFALCTHDPAESATLFSFDPINKKIKKIFSLAQIIRTNKNSLPQGKIHTPLLTGIDGKLYMGSHFAYPFGIAQPIHYEGGHLISFDPKNNLGKDLGVPVRNEGVLSMALNKSDMIIYGLTAPSSFFFAYDIYKKKTFNFGRISKKGSICRSLVLDSYGNVYGTFEKNHIFKFNVKNQKIEFLSVSLPDDNLEIKEWKGKDRGGVNYVGRGLWRCAVLNEDANIYYINAKNSRLFSFNPENEGFKNLTSMVNKISSCTLDHIYPTLSLVNYKDTVFYAFVNGLFDYSRSKNMIGSPMLISYNIKKNKKVVHGEICNKVRKAIGIAGGTVSEKGKIYLIGAIEVLKNEEYNKFNYINNKPFNLGLVEINIKNLK